MNRYSNKELEKARELSRLWDENEEHMGEMAAFSVACEQLGIDEDDGWELLALLDGDDDE